ncbi:uncharacterized protein pps [Prorops nasuta]|uniref:uncharacterized protein pps n=1 Tax=Prorops nasuta TaxID=863751 RepID=UPI0034CE05BB
MSSSYIVEPQESGIDKKDDTLIIVVNDDGTISVDQETLQNLIMNQSNANVSVVRLGQTAADQENGEVTLTVDPPNPTMSAGASVGPTGDPDAFVDPFMVMDKEQLDRLESALQSDEAKQILGENVTAMLDMLSVEEQQSSIRYSIELDHCYTNRLSPNDPKPKDPLPIVHSPDSDDMHYAPMSPLSSPNVSATMTDSSIPAYSRFKPVAKVNKPIGRPRKASTSTLTPAVTPKSSTFGTGAVKNLAGIAQQRTKANAANNEEEGNDFSSDSTESSESEPPSDNDSDFGPRGPRRGGIRARGARKGLTTRGGHTTGTRRRGPNKHLDVEQVRRLNLEMAAAVNAMKSPEKEEKSTFQPGRGKKQSKMFGDRKKEESHVSGISSVNVDSSHSDKYKKTNMINTITVNKSHGKGDLLQKQIFDENEHGNTTPKKQVILSKGKMINQTKLFTTKDGKLMQLPVSSKVLGQSAVVPAKSPISQITLVQHPVQMQTDGKTITATKTKPAEIKKEKRKSESNVEVIQKGEAEVKGTEMKVIDGTKKHVKKDNRKSPGFVSDGMEPALFSTPDIIRRVSCSSDSKIETPTLIPSICSTTAALVHDEVKFPSASIKADNITNLIGKTDDTSLIQQIAATALYSDDQGSPMIPLGVDRQKTSVGIPLVDELQPSLDSDTTREGIIQPMGLPHVQNDIVSKNRIEGEEHLLAQLEMEANKHEEDLLAEALLLQEELGVDLADHPGLVDQSSTVGEALSATALISPSLPPDVIPPKSMEPLPITVSSLRDVKKSKDEKEPIQIVRGGRIITLPPIEAPATRSKRLQEKTDSPPKAVSPKKKEKFNVQQAILEQEKLRAEMYEDEDDDDDEEEEDNSDSEDDPDRLWCICKRPHNNRFMICCDVCEDWFHGKCVHVSKAMGQQMEEKGIEWVCPNCTKKKSEESKTQHSPKVIGGKQRLSESSAESAITAKQNTPSQKAIPRGKLQTILPVVEQTMQISGTTQCVVCKKLARNSSIYCSDACILAHAQETLTKDKPSPGLQQKSKSTVAEASKPRDTNRVIVFERKTGKVLTGTDAPTVANLKTWLKENPTYEVVRSNNLNTIQIGNKTVTAIQTQGVKTIKPVAKLETVSKLVYTKPPGTKQTVLSTKKLVNVGGQIQQTITPIKQAIITSNPSKTPTLKQTKIQNLLQPAQKQASPTHKPTPIKKQESKAATPQPKLAAKPTPPKKPETEPIRMNIRKTLTELLTTRIRATEDLNLTDDEIADLASNIELEMYKYFKDTGAKYKAKYRSLVFNIKDTKNLTLFRKIADKSLTADAVVKLSPDEMASQELAEWREKETKHQLEMIKKNELDLMAQAKSIVVKTHKGEQIIENDKGIDHVDPKTPVQDIVTALNSGDNISSTVEDEKGREMKAFRDESKKLKSGDDKRKKDKEREDGRTRDKNKGKQKRDRSKTRHHRSRERDHSKTRDKSRERKSSIKRNKKDKDRDRDRGKDRDRKERRDNERGKDRESRQRNTEKNSGERHHRSRSRQRDYKDDKKEDDKRKDEKKDASPSQTEKPIEDRLWRHIEDEATTNTIDGNDSDVSDREPSSTVNIKTPDINDEHEREKEPEVDRETTKGTMQTVWRGFVNMVDVAKFFITAQEVSGNARDLMDDLPDTVDVVGRISHETVWDYISKMKKTGSKEILIIRLTAANDEEKIPYITLYSYLNSRSRLGVVGNVSKNIKDFYIMPFSNQSKIPPVLLPLIGPGFEESRPHLLLGIIVRNKRKRLVAVPPALPAKVAKKEDRSYTPPLSTGVKDKTTPPLSPSYKSGDGDKVVTQMTLESLNKAHVGMSRTVMDSATISKIVPELSSKIDLSSKDPPDDDGDAPYSPGQMDDEMNVGTESTNAPTAKNSNELQKKMDEINRQIEEQLQQIQNISSSFLTESSSTLPGLGLDPPAISDSEEAYSPSDSRSFTPPPPSLNAFAQPILDKVSDITIPPNLQEILANVKRQESSKVDPYLPAKPSATFLTAVNSNAYQNSDKYSSVQKSPNHTTKASSEMPKESKGTLSSLSDLDIIRKAEEELAARAVPIIPTTPVNPPMPLVPLVNPALTPPKSSTITDSPPNYPIKDNFKKTFVSEQPKPPGLEDEDLPVFPATGPFVDKDYDASKTKVPRRGGIVLSMKRKSDDSTEASPSKTTRIKSRWGQGPSE